MSIQEEQACNVTSFNCFNLRHRTYMLFHVDLYFNQTARAREGAN